MRVLTTSVIALLLAIVILTVAPAKADTFPVGIKTNTGAVPDLAPLWRLFYANNASSAIIGNVTTLTEFDTYATIPASGVLNPNVKFRLEAGGTYTPGSLGINSVQLAIILDGTGSTIAQTPLMHVSSAASTENVSKSWGMVCEFEPRTVGASGNCYADTFTTVMATVTNATSPTFNVTSTTANSLPSVAWTTAQNVKIKAKFNSSAVNNSFQLDRYRLYVIEK